MTPKNLARLVYLISAMLIGGVVISLCGCAHNPPRTVAIISNHAVLTAAQTAFQSEHLLCDPSAPLTQPIRTCTDAAHKLGLTDAAHQKFSDQAAPLFDQIGTYAKALAALPPGATTAPDASGIRASLGQLTAVVTAMAPSSQAAALLNNLSDVGKAVTDIEKAIHGGLPPPPDAVAVLTGGAL
jgi:hypothetical protein